VARSPKGMDPVAAYIAHLSRTAAPATVNRRSGSLHAFERHVHPAAPLTADAVLIEDFLARYRHPATRSAYWSDLNQFFQWASKRNLCRSNPMEAVDRARVPRRLPRPMAADTFARAVATALADLRLAMLLAGMAGLRRAEITRLRTTDLQLDGSVPMVVVRSGKGGRDRAVPLHPLVVAELRRWDLSDEWVFPSPLRPGQPIQPASLSSKVQRHMDTFGLEGRLHRMRHLFATSLADVSGGDLLLLAELLGHSSTATTMGYAQLSGRRAAAAVQALPVPRIA
jgi:integrase